MTQVISVMNKKGGVGKTTLSFNLAHGLAQQGFKVLAIDNDDQCNLTYSMLARGVKPEYFSADWYVASPTKVQSVCEKLWLLSGSDDLEEMDYIEAGPVNFADQISKVVAKGVFDFIIIDCNPQVRNLTMAAIMAANHVIVPMQPSKYAVDGLRRLFKTIRQLRSTGASRAEFLGIVMNLVSHTKLHRQTIQQLRKKHPDLIFDSVIRKRTAFEESPLRNQSIWQYNTDDKAVDEMRALVAEVVRKTVV